MNVSWEFLHSTVLLPCCRFWYNFRLNINSWDLFRAWHQDFSEDYFLQSTPLNVIPNLHPLRYFFAFDGNLSKFHLMTNVTSGMSFFYWMFDKPPISRLPLNIFTWQKEQIVLSANFRFPFFSLLIKIERKKVPWELLQTCCFFHS